MPRRDIISIVRPWADKCCANAGMVVWDIEYVKEGAENYLRLFVDLPHANTDDEQIITVEQCAAITREMNTILDEKDPIEESYIFEVSSPGIERALITTQHFRAYIGKAVALKLYKAMNGQKQVVGTLAFADDDRLEILPPGCDTAVSIERSAVAKAKLYVEF